jgi:hypothetical protein
MRTAIIRGKDLDQETVCDTLALFFSSDFLGFEDISPVRLNDADVIIVNLCKAGDGDLHRLRARRAALEAFPRIAIVTRGIGLNSSRLRPSGLRTSTLPMIRWARL